ncbi:MAG: YbaK/EbsC family protein [Syntrophales bacterium]|jgi:Ala-tRNA(Pro) deacylase|nr:YbaK/EbsC family protein [Syntrophales bacterium]MDY0043856.1 YbaK/EbsC family protein [Syntrophales bacterium]
MPAKHLREFLESNNISYSIVQHEEAYTAQETAKYTHIPGRKLAKTVMIRLDGIMSMAVLPASHRIDFNRLRNITGASEVELASEEEFANMFPGCEKGAMPPFGNLYGMDVFADNHLFEDQHIAFNAGSHTELIRIELSDFRKLVNPIILDFTLKNNC